MVTLVFLRQSLRRFEERSSKPARYAVPEKYGKDHTAEAVFVLGLIATLMVAESLFEGSGDGILRELHRVESC